MRFPPTESTMGKPVVISDELIDRVRAVENSMRPLPPIMVDDAAYPEHKRRKRRRKNRKQQREIYVGANDIVAVRPWSAFEDALSTLDEAGRNQTLLAELGLRS
jgi:hypothetical protein